VTIIGISGSLRTGSLNSALLRAAAAAAPKGVEVQITPIREIPLYDGDLERAEFPAAVTKIKERLAAADGLLLATPEYNHSIPGVLKNAIDWLSRPPTDIAKTFRGLPVALLGASPGRFGTVNAQNAWLPVIRTLGMRAWFDMTLALSNAAQAFGPGGELVDPATILKLQQFMAGFAEFAGRNRRDSSAPGS
jgi:NAD(P)H-dependent FMN reductase